MRSKQAISSALCGVATGSQQLSVSQSVIGTARSAMRMASTYKPVEKYTWAAEKLEALGETTVDVPRPDFVAVTDEMLHNPPQKIVDLSDQFFALNMLEVNQFVFLLQVGG